jgi:hypothetical protein
MVVVGLKNYFTCKIKIAVMDFLLRDGMNDFMIFLQTIGSVQSKRFRNKSNGSKSYFLALTVTVSGNSNIKSVNDVNLNA